MGVDEHVPIMPHTMYTPEILNDLYPILEVPDAVGRRGSTTHGGGPPAGSRLLHRRRPRPNVRRAGPQATPRDCRLLRPAPEQRRRGNDDDSDERSPRRRRAAERCGLEKAKPQLVLAAYESATTGGETNEHAPESAEANLVSSAALQDCQQF